MDRKALASLHKSPKMMHFSLRSLRISASSALKLPLIAENAEIRRGPQRKTAFSESTFVQSRSDVTAFSILAIDRLKVPSLEKEMLRPAGVICRKTVRISMQTLHIPS